MTKTPFPRTGLLFFVGTFVVLGLLLSSNGCKDRSSRRKTTVGARVSKKSDSAFLIDSLADGLNTLPSEIVLDLKPPSPILDDSTSANGQPVLATLNVTPAVPDGPCNFLNVPAGNANFRKLGVRPGDIVRYFINVDQDSVEHGIKQVSYLEFTVRRLDQNQPNNALILEGGLTGPIEFPERVEVWRFSDKRMNEINRRNTRFWNNPKTLIGWEPSPDESALVQLHDRANQWLRSFKSDVSSWQPEPLVAELPKDLLDAKSLAKQLSDTGLRAGPFGLTELRQLQQAIWLRDISSWAKQEAVSPVEIATALFDWTIRNNQLDSPEQAGTIHQPWQALMYGRGTAEQRAWVFSELCRQQQLDVVMLATDNQWWLPALLHDGKLYLFDTRLGIPIPGNTPGSIATLSEVIAEPTLLSNLDLNLNGEELKYPVVASDLKQITAQLVASPLQLSRRALLLEQALTGDDFVVLSANTRRLFKALESHPHLDQVKLWTLPMSSVLAEQAMPKSQRRLAAQRFLVFAQRPRLWKARVLHFQGTKEIPISNRNDPLSQPNLGHQQATALYQNPRIRPSNVRLAKTAPTKRAIYETAKRNASYWLGLLSYDQGKYKVAKDWLEQRTLAASPNGPWTPGAHYNLARVLEAMGDLPAAIKLLEADDSPQRHGNFIRARQLQQQLNSKTSEE